MFCSGSYFVSFFCVLSFFPVQLQLSHWTAVAVLLCMQLQSSGFFFHFISLVPPLARIFISNKIYIFYVQHSFKYLSKRADFLILFFCFVCKPYSHTTLFRFYSVFRWILYFCLDFRRNAFFRFLILYTKSKMRNKTIYFRMRSRNKKRTRRIYTLE